MTNELFAPDNVDRMLLRVLEETFVAEPWRKTAPIVVINDATGALSDWAVKHDLDVRFVQDSAALGAAQAPVTGPVATSLSPEALNGAATVVYRLARPLEALEELAWQVAAWADPRVLLLAGQLQRHLNFSMNNVLAAVFEDVSASRGYHKARALRAASPKPVVGQGPPRMPRKNSVTIASASLELRAFGLTFGAAKLDPGTRFLLETLFTQAVDSFAAGSTAVDLGCGNGTIAAVLAKKTRGVAIVATDDSASAVRSTLATLAANNIDDVDVLHQSGLVTLGDASVDTIVLNPPFHDGTEITGDIAQFLFSEAARVVKPGGILWTVFNASRGYRKSLTKLVGPTEQITRNQRFIITRSQKV